MRIGAPGGACARPVRAWPSVASAMHAPNTARAARAVVRTSRYRAAARSASRARTRRGSHASMPEGEAVTSRCAPRRGGYRGGMQTPFRKWSRQGLAIAAVVVGLCSSAHAEDAGDELATLQKNLADEQSALATSDCSTACRALDSIRRVADRICVLDPGDPCTSARARADAATRRVREACPECAILPGSPPPAMEAKTVSTDSGPPSESKRGGCAGCATVTSNTNDRTNAELVVLAGVVVALRLRRRRPKRV